MTGSSPYQGAILEHFRRPRNYGPLPNATAEAEGSNPLCGDRVRIAIAFDVSHQRVADARFTANACAICIASASLLTECIRGIPLQDARALTDDTILAQLGVDIPAARRRCALLPLEAMRRALSAGAVAGAEVVALLLAAGSARRFGGEQKLLAPVADPEGRTMPLVRQSAIRLREAGVERMIVVLGRESERVRESLAGVDLEFITNESFAVGMSTSIATGVRAVLQKWPHARGVLIALGDQPLWDARIVSTLVETFAASRMRIVAPRYRGARGNPVIFARELADELLAIDGDQGARDVIEREAGRVQYVDFDSSAPVDIDTPTDLERLSESLRAPEDRPE